MKGTSYTMDDGLEMMEFNLLGKGLFGKCFTTCSTGNSQTAYFGANTNDEPTIPGSQRKFLR